VTDAPALYRLAVWVELAAVPVTLSALLLVTAPYGRHQRPGWGPEIGSRWAWILMEGTSAAVFTGAFLAGDHRLQPVPLIFLAAWLTHYLYRSAVYPQIMRSRGRSMPLLIAASGMLFNLLNGWVNARWVSHLGVYEPAWARDPRFVLGLALMAGGFLIHVNSDHILIRLRRPGETDYRVPERGLHRWVCNPNYLGEIIEWAGWALATWSLAGLAFALFTVANLAPRAVANLRWYRETFEDYPARRKALIPGLL